MQDTELYRQLLGLVEPWFVDYVEMSLETQEIHVWVDHPPGAEFNCPECRKPCRMYDHVDRQWRHLDSCQFKTLVHAQVPRVECKVHGVRQVHVPWAEVGAQFTALFERFAIDLLQGCSKKKASALLCISWDEANGIMQRAVQRGLKRKKTKTLKKLGIDEKAFRKGHHYLTLVVDAEEGSVEYIAEGRTKESLDGFFQGLPEKQRARIDTVVMDLWEPYRLSVREHIPEADKKIVADRFHLMKHLTDAVDKVRKKEHRELGRQGDSPLTKTKYLWLYAQENVPPERREEFKLLRSMQLRVSRAWSIKEHLRGLWSYLYPASALKFFKHWFNWATHSRLKPIIDVAKLFQRHLPFILNYITHRLTNAVAEGLNSKIQEIKKRACGFRNLENFKTAIFFHCGKLQLYP